MGYLFCKENKNLQKTLLLCCRLFHAHTPDGIFLCTQALLQSRIRDDFAAVQTGTGTVLLEHLESSSVREVSSNLQIVGLDVDKEHLMLWDKKQVLKTIMCF